MNIRQAFEDSMKGELQGHELYKELAEKTPDKRASRFFQFLSEEELRHHDAIRDMYKIFSPDGKGILIPDVKRVLSVEDLTSDIFSDEFKRAVTKEHYEVSALELAMKLELGAKARYEKIAIEVDISEVGIFFTSMAEWEQDHYNFLKLQYDNLMEVIDRENRIGS